MKITDELVSTIVVAKEMENIQNNDVNQFVINTTSINLNGLISYNNENIFNGSIDTLHMSTGLNNSIHLVWESEFNLTLNYTMWTSLSGWNDVIQFRNWTPSMIHSTFYPYETDGYGKRLQHVGFFEATGWLWFNNPNKDTKIDDFYSRNKEFADSTLTNFIAKWTVIENTSSLDLPDRNNPWYVAGYGGPQYSSKATNELPIEQVSSNNFRLIFYITDQTPKQIVAWSAQDRISITTRNLIPDSPNYTEVKFHNVYYEPPITITENMDVSNLRIVYSAINNLENRSDIFMEAKKPTNTIIKTTIVNKPDWQIGWQLTDEGNASLPSISFGTDQEYYLTYLASNDPTNPNSNWSIRLRYTGLNPDFAIETEDITFNKESILEGNDVIINIIVTNIGAKARAWTNLTLTIDNTILPDTLVPPLDHGEKIAINVSWIARGLEDVQIICHADSTNIYYEINETNNIAVIWLSIIPLSKTTPSFSFSILQMLLTIIVVCMISSRRNKLIYK